MRKLVFTCLIALLPLASSAAEVERFLGQWAATDGDQTITWEFRADGVAVFAKHGSPPAVVRWTLKGKGAVIKAPPGDFIVTPEGTNALRISPPAAFREPPAVFTRIGG